MVEQKDILVSVVMCVYNTPQEYLDEAVSSILTQTHSHLELMIVDDHSKTDLYTSDLYGDPRVCILRNSENLGPSASRNFAFDRAKGKYIAIMDSDDISLPERFEKQIAYMEENPDVVACGTWFTHFGDKTNEVKRYVDDNEYYRCCLLFGNAPTLINPSVMLRKSTLEDHHIRYDERLRKGEDYKMWVQLSRLGRCTNLHENLFRYRVHNSQASQRLRTKDISPYDWIVMKEQYDAMGMVFTEKEEILMQKDFKSNEVDSYHYWQLLNRILSANQKSAFFAQDKLIKRVEEQWKQKIFNTSPRKILLLMKKLPFDEWYKIIRMEWERFFVKIGLRAKNVG